MMHLAVDSRDKNCNVIFCTAAVAHNSCYLKLLDIFLYDSSLEQAVNYCNWKSASINECTNSK